MEPRLLLSADALGIDAGVLSLDHQDQKTWELTTAADWSSAAATLTAGTDATETRLATIENASDSLDDIDAAPLSSNVYADRMRTEIIFLDYSVADGTSLLDDIFNGNETSITQVYLIDGSQDGVKQINNILNQHTDVDAVHIISHGSADQIHLGNSTLSSGSLEKYQQTLIEWGETLSESADILIYGCDIASDASGQLLVNAIGSLTGADVAASDDLTGNNSSGGDWELEYRIGNIESDVFTESDAQGWQGTLGEISSDGAGSARATAMDANGNYVVVYSTLNQDGDGWGVYAQRYNSAGVVQGNEILVNQYTTGDQRWASVGMSDTGEFVVTWSSSGGQDGDGSGIYARQFNADGTAADNEFLVNVENIGDQTNSSIDVDAAGNFIIVWQGNGPPGVDHDQDGVFFRRFNADGSAIDTVEVIAHAATDGTTAEFDPVVAWQTGGKFVIAWEQGNNDIYFQRFDNSGSMLGGQAQINAILLSQAEGLSIDSNDSGTFVVAYRSEALGGSIYVRAYNEDGTDVFTNGNTLNVWAKVGDSNSYNATVAIDDSGEVLVAYQTTALGGDIYLQRINANGSEPMGGEVALVTEAGDQRMPAIAIRDINNYAIAWNDVATSGIDTLTPTVTILTPIKDTYIDSNNTTNNYGNQATFSMDESGGSNQGDGRPLLQFDLSSIPAGATITGATLQLEAVNITGSGSSVIDVYEVIESWDEGSGGTDGASWVNSQTGTPWGTVGGAIDNTILATFNASDTPGLHTWDITALVEDWYLGNKINNGLMLGSSDTGTLIFEYGSSESGTSPELVITYTINNTEQVLAFNAGTTVDEGSTGNVITTAMLQTTDVDNTPAELTYTLTGEPSFGTLFFNSTALGLNDTFTQDDIDNGFISYEHDGSENFSDSFGFNVDDGAGVATADSFAITINPLNDAPLAVDDAAVVDEGNSVLINLVANDSDADNALDFSSIVITSAPANGSLVDNGDGTLTYTHNGSETTADSFSYTIDDVSGATSNVANVAITVNSLNDAPVAVDDSAVVDEGNSVLINLVANDSDADNALDFSSIVITSAPANGSLVDNGDDTLTYTHNGSETTGDSFSYTIDDVSGATSNVANVAITVSPINDEQLLAVNNGISVDEGSTGNVVTTLMLETTDVDNTPAELTYTLTGLPGFGTLFLNSTALAVNDTFTQDDINNGRISYEHDGSENFSDSFGFSVDDSTGVTTTDSFTINVTPVNDAPTITSTALTTATEDSAYSYTFTVSDVDVGDTLIFSAPTLPAWLNFNPTTGELSGTPTNADVGDHNVVLQVNDGTVDISQSFTITVINSNDAPTATNLNSISGYNEGDPTVAITDIVVSDSDTGETISATLSLADTTTGALSVNDGATYNTSTGVWTITDTVANVNIALANLVFMPNTENNANTTISVIIDDGNEDSSSPLTGTISLDVTPVNDAPVLGNNNLILAPGDTVILNTAMLSATDVDHANPSITFTVSNVIGGQFELVDTPGVAVTNFTQAQMTAGSVVFIDDGDAVAPAYDVTVSDGLVSMGPQGATISLAVPPPPTISTAVTTPPPLVATTQSETNPTEATQTESTTDETEKVVTDETTEKATITHPLPDITTNGTGDSTEVASLVPDIDVSVIAASNTVQDLLKSFLIQHAVQTAAGLFPLPSAFELDALTTEIRSVLVSDGFNDSLDRMRDDISSATNLHQNIVASSIAATTSLSVGYIAWLVRGGVLLSTALSSLPAWQFVDPLPVLAHKNNKEDDGEDDSLEEIIKAESRKADKQENKHTHQSASDEFETALDERT